MALQSLSKWIFLLPFVTLLAAGTVSAVVLGVVG